jgi:hypothetical protein
MGFEVTYQAIPKDCGLIELARAEVDVAEKISLVPLWFRRKDGGPRAGREDEEDSRLWKWCCQLATLHPDLRARNCDLDRRWDQLHYLLSATRRGEQASQADRTIDCAFEDGETIAERAIAGQGVPVRYLTHETVRTIAALVEQIDHAALARYYDPKRMEAEGVYKFYADRADATEWHWITKTFDRFRQFFVETASRGDAVIVVQD